MTTLKSMGTDVPGHARHRSPSQARRKLAASAAFSRRNCTPIRSDRTLRVATWPGAGDPGFTGPTDTLGFEARSDGRT